MKCSNANMLRAAALAFAAALAGCTPNDTTMGGALRHDMALQVIDPDPQAQTDAIEGGSGVRAAAAVDRYNQGRVKEPVITSTKSSGGNGGGGQGPN